MIEKLTHDQEVASKTYYRQYKTIGECCDETDRSVTVELDRMYKMMGEDSPIYIWVDNMWEANVVFSAMTSGKDFPELDDAIDGGEMISRSIIEDVASNVKIEKFDYNIGNLNAYWLSYLTYCKDILGIEYDYGDYEKDILDVWNSLVTKCGYVFFEKGYCILCNRPQEVHFDERNELHNEAGPAVTFRRGTECDVYSIHGVVVPENVVEEPESITIDMIRSEENAEIKRIMMERMGIGKYLDECGAKLVDADMTFVDQIGGERVPRALMEDGDGRRFLVASDGSTKRVYHMQVPSECQTCTEASKILAGGIEESDIIAVG